MEDFFARIHFFLHDFPKYLSGKWNIFWGGNIEKSNASSHCYTENSANEKRKIPFAEINSILSRVGIVGLDDCENKSNLDEEDLVGLFEEEEPSFEEIKESFKVFDVDEDGFVGAADLQRVVLSLGLKEGGCSLDECNKMIKPFDVNGDGFIDFQEFVSFMERCLC
ncbi:probable calcium-binding protein CML46 [Salvia miltiorrhiza]|uniref:probable calcium-binding protein CML46 n=1 Tax=Salvia miltiorrhiza TaxID=226208 RepID=UPI0025AC44CA|nr:probable calcium-binding protein CML46 [Salvia miltiorrhiza]